MKTKLARLCRTRCLALALLSLGLFSPLLADDAAAAKLVAGSKLESLTVGATTFQNVLIRSVSARSAMITFDGGMKSILLRDLSPELQERFNYNPDADHAQEATAKAGQAAAAKKQQERIEAVRKSRAATPISVGKFDQLLRSFGQSPDLAEQVDLRPRFSELGLWVKDQGHRPSCAVFAMVSALEFQNAEASATADRFSEEYLYWATCKTLNRQTADDLVGINDGGENQSDAGFTLNEVATALRTYGVPLRDKAPNHFSGKAMAAPSADVIEEARRGVRLSVHSIPGQGNGALLATNIIHALNLGIPVPIGMRWPDARVWRVQYLEDQKTDIGFGHAVTIVGYRCKTGRIEDAVFVFKNSWGPHWGQAGYGTASYRYLAKNLNSAVVLEVQPQRR